jgi:trk system potassium uptake protein TrkH
MLMWVAVAMLPSVALSWTEGLFVGWASAASVTAIIGATLYYGFTSPLVVDQRTGLIVVGIGWLFVISVGTLPFLFSRVTSSPAAAFFESASGFTTTGATVFAVVETLPSSILLWRSITHWLGGMGIIVLGVAILPFLGVGGAQLFRAEAPGISGDRLRPRMTSTARLLWTVYAGMTALLGVKYVLLGMPVFDALNHAMSTLATGGFSTRTASMADFSGAIQVVTILFMLLAGTNFALHVRLLSGNARVMTQDSEWRAYMGLCAAAVLATVLILSFSTGVWSLDNVRSGAFNVVAVITTTGFATDDFASWPMALQVMLLGLMFTGAMGGSTGGGLKVVRIVVLAKHTFHRFRLVLHPRAVVLTRLGRRTVTPEVFLTVVELFALYIATHAVGTLILTAIGHDFLTAVSAALAAMSSIGPGLGTVGPAGNYGDLSGGAHVTLSVLMLLGRLEFYTFLILFFPETWVRVFRKSNN